MNVWIKQMYKEHGWSQKEKKLNTDDKKVQISDEPVHAT